MLGSNSSAQQGNKYAPLLLVRQIYLDLCSVLHESRLRDAIEFDSDNSFSLIPSFEKLDLADLSPSEGGQVIQTAVNAVCVWFLVLRIGQSSCLMTRKPIPQAQSLNKLYCRLTQHPNDTIPDRTVRSLANLSIAIQGYRTGGEEERFKDRVKDVLYDMLNHLCLQQGEVECADLKRSLLDLFGLNIFNLYAFSIEWLTWVGFDMDGSSLDKVNATSMREARRLDADFVITQYQSILMQMVNSLREVLDHEVSEVLDTTDTDLYEVLTDQLLGIKQHLEATRRGVQGSSQCDPCSYPSVTQFIADLKEVQNVIAGQSEASQSAVSVAWVKTTLGHLIARAQKFGFQLMRPEPRVNALFVDPLVDQVYHEQFKCTLSQNEADRLAQLMKALKSGCTVDLMSLQTLSRNSRWVIECLNALAQIQLKECGLQMNNECIAIKSLAVSNTERISTLLGLRWILQYFGLRADPIGLFETEHALREAGHLLESLILTEGVREQPRVVFLGGSDTMRTCGAGAGWWLLYKAQLAVLEVSLRYKQPVEIYYGRADHPLRWGGDLAHFIAAQPKLGAVHFLLQGSDKVPVLLTRELARDWLSGISQAQGASSDVTVNSENIKLMDAWTEVALSMFKNFVAQVDFGCIMQRAPIEEVSYFRRSCRPKTRGGDGVESQSRVMNWADRRAIATIQAFEIVGFPIQLLGTGTGLDSLSQSQVQSVGDLYLNSSFVRFFFDELANAYSHVDLEIFDRLVAGYEHTPVADLFVTIATDTKVALQHLEVIRRAPLPEFSNRLGVAQARRAFMELYEASNWTIPEHELSGNGLALQSLLCVTILAGLGTGG